MFQSITFLQYWGISGVWVYNLIDGLSIAQRLTMFIWRPKISLKIPKEAAITKIMRLKEKGE